MVCCVRLISDDSEEGLLFGVGISDLLLGNSLHSMSGGGERATHPSTDSIHRHAKLI